MEKWVIRDRVAMIAFAVVIVLCASVVRAIAAATESDEGGKPVAMKDLPNAVREAAGKAIAGGSLKRVVVEKEDGQDAYSVEAVVSGVTKEFTFAADGTLVDEEEVVAFTQLPPVVRLAAEKYFGDSHDLRASKEIADGVISYEIEGSKDGASRSATFSTEGSLIQDEEDDD